jgi:hypothetical protein
LWHALSERPLRFALDNFELNAMETAAWLAMAAWLCISVGGAVGLC